jgi:hypothetical protein
VTKIADEALDKANTALSKADDAIEASSLAEAKVNEVEHMLHMTADAETLAPGSAATAEFDHPGNVMRFGIPQGDKGDKGDQGDTPYVGNNGHWWVNNTDTGISSNGDLGATLEYDLTDQVDGETQTFTLPGDGPTFLTQIFYGGQRLTNGVDFTISGNTLTTLLDEPPNTDEGRHLIALIGPLEPYVGANGNWWAGSTDLRIPAATRGKMYFYAQF